MKNFARMFAIGGSFVTLLLNFETSAAAPIIADSQPGLVSHRTEIDVYEAVLHSWFGKTSSTVQVDEHLSPAPKVSDKEISGCLRDVNFQPAPSPPSVLTSLHDVRFQPRNIRIIDGTNWHADDEQLTNNVARSEFRRSDLQQAFSHALTSFSRIQFDQGDRLALVTFSDVCGRLCGSGSTLLMQSTPQGWKIAKRCRQWVS